MKHSKYGYAIVESDAHCFVRLRLYKHSFDKPGTYHKFYDIIGMAPEDVHEFVTDLKATPMEHNKCTPNKKRTATSGHPGSSK